MVHGKLNRPRCDTCDVAHSTKRRRELRESLQIRQLIDRAGFACASTTRHSQTATFRSRNGADGYLIKLLHSTFDCGFRTIGTTVDLVVPASLFVLVGNLSCLTRGSLLARSEFGRLAGGF